MKSHGHRALHLVAIFFADSHRVSLFPRHRPPSLCPTLSLPTSRSPASFPSLRNRRSKQVISPSLPRHSEISEYLESRSRDFIVVANGVSLEESSDFLAFASSRETSMGRRGGQGNPMIAIISPLTRQFTRVFVKRLNLLSSDYLSR